MAFKCFARIAERKEYCPKDREKRYDYKNSKESIKEHIKDNVARRALFQVPYLFVRGFIRICHGISFYAS
jgi:hypothetical protein